MLAIAVLFLVPAYYLAKSKGYNVAFILVASGVLSAGVPLTLSSLEITDTIPWVNITFPFLSLGIVWLLPEKEGAPGKTYLKITFQCPECREEVTFDRSKEGKADLCPTCGEIVTVPLDEFSPKPTTPKRDKPTISSGSVCYASFGDEMVAFQLQALFEDHGIESEVIGGTGGGSLPQLSGSQGFKISIDIDDWDKAVGIENVATPLSEPAEKMPVESGEPHSTQIHL